MGLAAGRFLIVTADDFGLHERVNEAVERASAAGVLSAASLMVGAPAAADAVRRARRLPHLRVGLHLVLADGHAVLPGRLIPDLVDEDGCFGGRMVVDGVRYFLLPGLRRQVEAEVRAQFEAFARTGLLMDHVNAHKHFHLHPSLLEIILRVAADFGGPPMRLPREIPRAVRHGAPRLSAWASAAFLAPWLARMKRRLEAAGIAHNDRVFGIARSGGMDERELLEILASLPDGVTEIYLHPAIESEHPITPSMSGYRHADELAALLSPKVRSALAAAKVPCGGYRDIARSRDQPESTG